MCHPGIASFLLAVSLAAQTTYPSKFSPALPERDDVKQAIAFIDAHFEQQVKEWIHITEIPAPSGQESERAAYVKAEFEKAGLQPAIDPSGNVVARRKGTGGGPTLVFAAHMDTVFPRSIDVRVTKKPDGTLHAPGVGDNSASVANLLQALRALQAANVRTRGDVVFLATVQEEAGLKGMYAWLERNKGAADMLVALDGSLGPVRYGALGVYWSRMKFTAPGAHTNRSRGVPNPVRAAAQCITDIYTIPLPEPGAPVQAVYNAGGMMSAGEVVNAVPREVTFTVDLRTVDKELLGSLDDAMVSKCEQAAQAQRVTFTREWIMRSAAGGRPEDLTDRRRHPIVQTAVDVLRYLNFELPKGHEADPDGSTDANAGVVNSIPSISTGRARGEGQHTLGEWADIDSARIGAKQIVLLAAALTEPDR
ncbi:MAG: M20/M25/M40 family metallo-hydrolase [Bryobacterales bacterium]|nr:M20/M25/M40 family metallo-hydrolase [Bryobacterales bacterium]